MQLTAAGRSPWAIVAAAVPLRLALALGTDLSPDEAYYLCAAREASWMPPLVDHPPLLPWLLRLTDRFTSWPVELRVRLWPMAFSLAIGVLAVWFARRRGADPTGCALAAWVGSFALLPTAGGFIATPDGPVLLGVLGLLAWATDPPRTPRQDAARALGVGLLVLLAALAKVIVVPIALLAIGMARQRSRQARALLLAVLCLAIPLLIPSLAFQLRHAFMRDLPVWTASAPEHGASAGTWSAAQAAGALVTAAVAQALLWSPWVLVRGLRMLSCFPALDRALVGLITGLVAASALARAIPPEPNWWAPAAVVVIAGAACRAGELTAGARAAMLAMVLLPTLVAVAHTLHPFLPLPAPADPTARLHGWSQGAGPLDAAGVGAYGPWAERCIYLGDCEKITSYFNQIDIYSSGTSEGWIRR